jgi:hypothetical protein
MSDLQASHEATVERFNKRNRPTTATGRRRQAMEQPAIQKVVEPHLARLIELLDGKLEQKPEQPPRWLGPLIGSLPSDELALAMLGARRRCHLSRLGRSRWQVTGNAPAKKVR